MLPQKVSAAVTLRFLLECGKDQRDAHFDHLANTGDGLP